MFLFISISFHLVQVKHHEGDEKKYGSDIESDAGSEEDNLTGEGDEVIKVYTEIFKFLKAGETVAKALKVSGSRLSYCLI